MFDVSSFTAIVTPPQVAILAAGRSAPRLVPDNDGGVRTAAILTATLSADHRALDGADAAVFLGTLKSSLEQPEWLLTNEGHLEEAKS
jgi:pyruvate dehydrogenase E2 component (dihydrolipoamide acetyltransferase)